MLDRLKRSGWFWSLVGAIACVGWGPALLDSFQLKPAMVPDFYQEYASARNLRLGVPIYTELATTIGRDTRTRWAAQSLFARVNAHPPSSVLLAVPFTVLGFEPAFLSWNILSLVGLAIAFGIGFKHPPLGFPRWGWAPLLILVFTSNPLRQQIIQGQLNLILLPLLTGTWAALRIGRPGLAGCLLGIAAAVKLYPAYLIAYFLWRRRGDVVVPAVGTFLTLTGLTAAVLGLETYGDYLQDVLPVIGWFRIGWNNGSVLGFWSRLFDPISDAHRWYWFTQPLWHSPALARFATVISDVAITLGLVWATRQGRPGQGEGPGFATAVTAMLLVTPVTWEHYYILLLVPLLEVIARPPTSRLGKAALLGTLLVLWSDPTTIWGQFVRYDDVARPAHVLLLISLQFYALLGLFLIQLASSRSAGRSLEAGSPPPPPGAASPAQGHLPATPVKHRRDHDDSHAQAGTEREPGFEGKSPRLGPSERLRRDPAILERRVETAYQETSMSGAGGFREVGPRNEDEQGEDAV